jgi:hypothetical protein
MKCKVEGCERDAVYTGLCGMHYKRKWRHGDVNYCDVRTIPVNLEPCLAEGCNERGAIRGYCNLHYNRWYRYGRTHTIIGMKGSGSMSANGYIVYRINNESFYEHILLAEKALGRPLPEGAVVHHTGKPWDNYGPFKLVICPSQSYHLLLHRRMRELGYENNKD